ncbi:MAG: ABC transporter permease subunit [Acidobacteriia bacterium]|nr:ABC transporter permease subunit [Terriglobia bacterium]
MRKIWTIAMREFKVYFTSPIAYIVLAMFAVVFGYFFTSGLAFFMDYSASVQAQGGAGAPPLNVNQFVIEPSLGNMSIVLLFLVPMITMRLFAEEQRSGTIELLLTSPLQDYHIICGKWLGALLLYACLLLVAVLNISVLFLYTTPDWKPLLVSLLGLLLMGGSMIAIGTFLSTLTRNQIVAGALTFGVLLLLWVLNWISSYETSTFSRLCEYLAISPHFEQFSKGVIELKDLLYYVSAISLGLFLSKRSLEALRWKA